MVLRCAVPTPSPPPPPSTCFKSPSSHRDGVPRARHTRNCRRFWRLKASILVTVITFGPSCFHHISRVPTVTGTRAVLLATLRTVVTLGPLCFFVALQKYQQSQGWGLALVLYNVQWYHEPSVTLLATFCAPLYPLHKPNANNMTQNISHRGRGGKVLNTLQTIQTSPNLTLSHKTQTTGHRPQATGHRPQATGHRPQDHRWRGGVMLES